MTRDPRTDPQPGDEVRVSGQLRTVIRREGDDLWCQDGAMRYKTTVRGWQEWCQGEKKRVRNNRRATDEELKEHEASPAGPAAVQPPAYV